MSSSQSDFVCQLLPPSCVYRLNCCLPPGFHLDPRSVMKRASKQVAVAQNSDTEAGDKGRKRSRPWHHEKAKGGCDLSERDWGLKAGGEPARLCFSILQNLKRHVLSAPFLQPVDPVALNLPDYLEIVIDPIDLSTVERNLKAGVYANSLQFANDVRRIWLNSFTYNAHGSDMFYITLELSTYFEKQFREVEDLVFGSSEKLTRDKEALQEYMERPMTLQEKRLLATNLRRLSREHAPAVSEIALGTRKSQHFQVNVEKLPARTCRELEKYVKLVHQAACRASRQRPQRTY